MLAQAQKDSCDGGHEHESNRRFSTVENDRLRRILLVIPDDNAKQDDSVGQTEVAKCGEQRDQRSDTHIADHGGMK
jgi:hypothetical protein